jgi:hypothetical protein
MPNDPREQQVAQNEETKNKSVEEYYARSEAAKPTPTQQEADRAKVGLPVDEKEPDGSEPEEVTQRRVLESRLPGNQPYANRALTSQDTGEEAKRGPGRPPKAPEPAKTPEPPKATEPHKG